MLYESSGKYKHIIRKMEKTIKKINEILNISKITIWINNDNYQFTIEFEAYTNIDNNMIDKFNKITKNWYIDMNEVTFSILKKENE